MTPEVSLAERFRAVATAGDRPLHAMWVSSVSPIVAEISAHSGVDMVIIDAEHAPNTITTVLQQVQAMAGAPTSVAVRLADNDSVEIKKHLDIGVRHLIVPMVDSAEDAIRAARSVAYAPEGVRGVGAALARASGWNRDRQYLSQARAGIHLTVQIESARAVEAIEEILVVPGVDSILIGASDLAASMGHLGKQDHPDVIAAVEHCLELSREAGIPAGVNAFDEVLARRYAGSGAAFVILGSDVTILASATSRLASLDLGT